MSFLSLAAALLLSQTDPAAEPPAEPAAAEAEAAPAAAAAPTDPAAAPAAVRTGRAPNPEELQRQLDRIRKLPTDSAEPVSEPPRKSPDAATAVAEVADPISLKLGSLSEAEQVRYTARAVFNSIISGDARSLVLQSAYPFQLEDRRLEMPDELHKEWLKSLRAKRTDLLTLYDVEVLTPAEMEKKYGRPPARLNAMPWKSPRTLVAVGNLSGHAAVAVFRAHASGRWQLVGYHD
jgi:hypothetical protein